MTALAWAVGVPGWCSRCGRWCVTCVRRPNTFRTAPVRANRPMWSWARWVASRFVGDAPYSGQ